MNGTLVPMLTETIKTAQVLSTMCMAYNLETNYDNIYSSSDKAH